jgi:hypothetical protein
MAGVPQELRNELKAIRYFDRDFVLAEKHDQTDCMSFLLRQIRWGEITHAIQEALARN